MPVGVARRAGYRLENKIWVSASLRIIPAIQLLVRYCFIQAAIVKRRSFFPMAGPVLQAKWGNWQAITFSRLSTVRNIYAKWDAVFCGKVRKIFSLQARRSFINITQV